jgi:hypothetical protein
VTQIACAVTIQSCWRAYRIRKWIKIKRIRNRAAMLIQLIWKRHIAKRKLHFLKTMRRIVFIPPKSRIAYLPLKVWHSLKTLQLPIMKEDIFYEQNHIDFFCQQMSLEVDMKAIEVAPKTLTSGSKLFEKNNRLRYFIRRSLNVPSNLYEQSKKGPSKCHIIYCSRPN